MNRHFVIAGAQRSGTTYLYKLLEQHPDICMSQPMRPEPKFFLGDGSEVAYADYLDRHFAHRVGQQLLGEKSTSYIERDDAIARIAKALPGARIVFLLRDPALRAYSNWRFSRAHGLEPLDFAAAMAAEPTRNLDWDRSRFSVSPFSYGARGHYAEYLDRWLAHFPRDQLIVLTSDGLFEDPAVIKGLLSRLGVDADITLQSPGQVNAASEEGVDIAPEMLSALRQRYRDDTHRLAKEWHLDVAPWLG